MRRYFARTMLFLIIAQSSGVALPGDLGLQSRANPSFHATTRSLIAAVESSSSVQHPIIQHTPVPRRPMVDYRDPRRYARLVPKPHVTLKIIHAVRPIDLTKLRHDRRNERRAILEHGALLGRSKIHHEGVRQDTLSASVTGVLPWWTYQARAIPGVGEALVNVVNLNFLIAADDVDIPTGGIELDFHRMYNSESEHDANNDDGSTPSVFGNRWTNNLDVHLAWVSTGQNTGTVSVYTEDGARDDYSCEINVVETCTSDTPGVYDLLGTTDLTDGTACQFQWTMKSGVSYMFNAPYAACGNGAGEYGRLIAIYGRNSNFSVQLAYSWVPNSSNPENLAQIVATHEPDGAQLILTFGVSAETSFTELVQITRPDGETINYHYTAAGDLDGVDKPGNNPVLLSGETLPTQFADGTPIVQGNLPQIYDIERTGLLEVCGPRAAITILDGNTQNDNADGACVDFDYTNHQLSDWWTRGVLNPTPEDNVLAPSSIQTGPSTGFVQWDDTTFFNNIVEGGCGFLSEMTDAYGHDVEWCYNSSSLVTQTSAQASASEWLTTSQTWDANNDLTSTTDPRGNTTNIAYDSDGNVVEVSLPKQATLPQGSLRPTYLYDHDLDGHNDLTNYCDPANNASNGWNPSPGPTPCASSGSTHYTKFQYNTSDPNEPYGCTTETITPSSYQRQITYGGNCGNGLVTQVTGQSYTEQDGTLRTPTQTFTYYNIGTLHTYNPGDPNNAVSQITYTSDGMNRVRSVADPDGVTSDQCYNLDGSVFYSETARQNKLDGSPSCPSTSGATPPPYAAAYGYDPDGDAATSLNHHNCTTGNGNCTANNPASTTCYGAETVPAGMTCNFYDGLDRLVEVKLPYDTSYDLYKNPWVTRYLYDLTGNPQSFDGSQSFSAYGNLFTVQELLPSSSTVQVYATASPGSVGNGSYTAIKGTAYDGLDRPVTKYSATGQGSTPYTTEALTWDSGPLDSDVAGFVGEDCNSASPSQCQEFDYTPDGELMTFDSSDGSSPERAYVYDPDARTEQIRAPGTYTYPQTYTYNVDGYLATSVDAANNTNDQATLTHNRYVDDSEESLDVSNFAFSQSGLLTYSYRNDGPLQTEQINDGQVAVNRAGKTTISYAFTNAGRLLTRAESGIAAYPSPTPQTTITYATSPPTGLVTQETTPVTTLSAFSYTAENELLNVASSSNPDNCAATYNYTLRGELAYSAPNCVGSGGGAPLLANGVSFQQPIMHPTEEEVTWNDLMAVMTSITSTNSNCSNGQTCVSGWSYPNNSAARMTSEVSPYPPVSVSPPPTNTTTVRTYDAENHLLSTQFQNGASTNYENEVVAWGPDGHPLKIGTYIGSNSEQDERLHWNGNQLLFTTHLESGQATLDDVKVDVQGDILPGDGGYSGLTFYDRAPGGTIMGCHNYTGTSYSGLGGGNCVHNQSPPNNKMPTSGVWGGNPYYFNFYYGGGVGNGGTLTMPRTDGINDGFDTIQGVRSYNNNSGAWTTPDSYAGSVYSPASQKSYLWNNNNPMDYSDPSGYDDGVGGEPQTTDQQWCTNGTCQDSNGNQTPECPPGGGSGCTEPPPISQASASVPSAARASSMLSQFGPDNVYNILGATLGVFGFGGAAERGTALIGSTFGKLGQVVERAGVPSAITGVSEHFANQAVTRGVSPTVILDALHNPLVVLQQSSGTYLFIGSDGAIVLTPEGIGVTTYSAADYDVGIQGILNRLNGPP
jgi:YD repeat-containing protein